MRGLILMAATALILPGGAARAGQPNPDILLGQVGAPVTRATVRVENLHVPPGGLGVANVPPRAGSRTAMDRPKEALDRCEAILRGEAEALEGLNCGAGQLQALHRELEAEPRSSLSVDLDRFASIIQRFAGDTGDTAAVTQDGDNYASLKQNGSGNLGQIDQTGEANSADLTQTGSNLIGSIAQTGNTNTASLTQTGSGLAYAIVQDGTSTVAGGITLTGVTNVSVMQVNVQTIVTAR